MRWNDIGTDFTSAKIGDRSLFLKYEVSYLKLKTVPSYWRVLVIVHYDHWFLSDDNGKAIRFETKEEAKEACEDHAKKAVAKLIEGLDII